MTLNVISPDVIATAMVQELIQTQAQQAGVDVAEHQCQKKPSLIQSAKGC